MFIAGIARSERELWSRLIAAMTGGTSVGRYTVAGTGDGQLHGLELPQALFNTAIVLTCTIANTNEAEFSVSVGGAGQVSARTHKPYNYQGLNFMIGMGATPWVVGDTITIAAQGSNTLPTGGEVYLECFLGSVEEDLTLTCATASTAGAGATFTLVGSVSGSHATIVQGARTEKTGYTVTVQDGVDFAVGEAVSFPLRANDLPALQRWELLQTETAPTRLINEETTHDQIIRAAFRGKGSNGQENIYIQINRWGTIDRFVNWGFTGMTGWEESIDVTLQQGYLRDTLKPCATMQSEYMSFYISITGRRVMGVIGSGEVYEHFYLGLMQGHQAPTHYPYPLFIGGSMVYHTLDDNLGGLTGYHQTEIALHTAYWKPCLYNTSSDDPSQAVVYTFNNSFVRMGNAYVNNSTSVTPNGYDYATARNVVMPAGIDGMSRMRANFDGTYTPVPVWLAQTDDSSKAVLGRLDGLMAISSDNGQQAGNVLVNNGAYHIVFNNVYRQGANDFCMVEVK